MFLSSLYETTFVTISDSGPTYGFTYARLARLLAPAECNAETNWRFWKIHFIHPLKKTFIRSITRRVLQKFWCDAILAFILPAMKLNNQNFAIRRFFRYTRKKTNAKNVVNDVFL